MSTRGPDSPGAFEEGGASPGRRLQEARLAAKLTVDDVAARLRLERRVVEALERDDHGSLPAPTFVRGYLRGYARLLDLPPGPIVEAYDRIGFSVPSLVADISSRPEVRSGDVPVRLVTYVLVVGLVVLGFLWWRSEKAPVSLDRIGAETGLSAVAPQAQRPAPTPSREATGAPVTAPATEAERAPAPRTAVASAPSAAPAPAAPGSAADAPTAGRAPPAAPTSGSPQAPITPPAAATSQSPPAAPAPASATPPAEPSSPAGQRLVLRLKHDSWVEVYDKAGKRLFFNLAKAGQTLALSGTPPFRVILGYARDAEVEYNDAPFDPSPFINKDIARFTVGG